MAGRSLRLNHGEGGRSRRSEVWGGKRRGKDESEQPGSDVQGTGQSCTSSEGTPYPLRALQIYHNDCIASDRKAS